MTEEYNCPVCGHTNIREYYAEDVGLVEEYYHCDNCGYFSEMFYGPTSEGIDIITGSPKDRARKEELAKANKDKIQKLGLQVYK